MSFKIKQTNTGLIKQLKKQMKSGKVKVGLPKGKSGAYDDGLTVIEVGAINEFGNEKIPERSFVRVPVQQNKIKYMDLARKQAQKIYAGKTTVNDALGILGLFMSDKMKASFTDNDWQENAQSTINMKGSSTPLIDSGQLRQSITWQIVKDN